MTPEEYKQLKEAEKEHLRAIQKLKQTAHLLQRRKAVNEALGDMAAGSQDAIDTHEEMLDKLTLETAQHEARLEIALENVALEETEGAPAGSAPSTVKLDEELAAERAKSLIRQMKLQMGVQDVTDDEAPARPSASKKKPVAPTPPKPDPPPLERPDKTIGRMR